MNCAALYILYLILKPHLSSLEIGKLFRHFTNVNYKPDASWCLDTWAAWLSTVMCIHVLITLSSYPNYAFLQLKNRYALRSFGSTLCYRWSRIPCGQTLQFRFQCHYFMLTGPRRLSLNAQSFLFPALILLFSLFSRHYF